MKKILMLMLVATIAMASMGYGAGFWTRLRPTTRQELYDLNCIPYTNTFVEVYRDEFNQGQLDKWFWKPNLLNFHHAEGSGETDEYVTESQLLFSTANNGTLNLQAVRQPIYALGIDGEPATLPFKEDRFNWNFWHYQSGAITSKWGFKQGKFEIRCQIPAGKGMWPAFWLFGECGDEIDIFEFMKDQNDIQHDKRISCSVHSEIPCGTGSADTETYNLGSQFGATTGMHTYAAYWDDFKIVFLVDGNPIRTFYHYYRILQNNPGFTYIPITSCQSNYPVGTYAYDPNFSDVMLDIIINSAVRLSTNQSQLPRDFLVDFFALYEPVDCQQVKLIDDNADLAGIAYQSLTGDRTIDAGIIRVDPSSPMVVHGPPFATSYKPGDLLIMTAVDEIIILPGFDVEWDGNLIGQISPCTVNKSDPWLEDTNRVDTIFVVGDSAYNSEQYHQLQNHLEPRPTHEIWPNPSVNYLHVSNLQADEKVTLTDISGRVLLSTTCQGTSLATFDVSSLSAGLYFVHIYKGDDPIWREKLVISRD